MGGGLILNQMIHELDYLNWIFGKPSRLLSSIGNNGNLKIDVEDHCDCLLIYNKGYEFTIHLHADFIQSPPKRNLRIIFEKGTVELDILNNILSIQTENYSTKVCYNIIRNDLFIEELELFFNYIQTRNQKTFTIEEGLISLQLVEVIQKSAKTRQIISIGEENGS